MGTTAFHLIGYGLIAVMWVVAIYGLIETARTLRDFLEPHGSALFNAVREDWATGIKPAQHPAIKKHASPKAGRASQETGPLVTSGRVTKPARSRPVPAASQLLNNRGLGHQIRLA